MMKMYVYMCSSRKHLYQLYSEYSTNNYLLFSAFPAQVISFYVNDRNHEERKGSKSGEVPVSYQNHSFQLSISGHRWAVPTSFRTTKAEAILLMKRCGAPDFEEILRTESVEDVINPSFTKRASFLPLTMRDSQSLAAQSLLRIDILINSKVQFSTQFLLSRLLWEQKFDAKFEPHISPFLIRLKKVRQGSLHVNIVRGRSIYTRPDGHKMRFSVKVSAALWSRLREGNIRMAVSTLAERGQWSRLYISECLRKPIRESNSSIFPSVSLNRNNLVGHNKNNPIRIELYGVRRGGTLLMLGFSQVTLSDLSVRKSLDWVQTEYSYISPELKVRAQSELGNQSEVHLLFRRPVIGRGLQETHLAGQMRRKNEDLGTPVNPKYPIISATESFPNHSWLSSYAGSSKKNANETRASVRFPGDYDEKEVDESMGWGAEMVNENETLLNSVQHSSSTLS